MALSTFGAIMGFAINIVEQTKIVFHRLAERAGNKVLREQLDQFAAEQEKTYSLMEQARREHVTEMILEPIAGLNDQDYAVDLEQENQEDDAHIVRIALMLEDREQRFFHDASAKVSLPEVARLFRKISRKKEENLAKLRSLRLN